MGQVIYFLSLNLTRIAELRKEDLVKHIRKRTIQTGRLFFSSSLNHLLVLAVFSRQRAQVRKHVIHALSARQRFYRTFAATKDRNYKCDFSEIFPSKFLFFKKKRLNLPRNSC